MGSDKALLEVDGRPLVDRVAAALATVADPVLLAPGRSGRLGPRPWREVEDAVPDRGPLGGLVAGLRDGAAPLVAAVAVDMPLVDPAVIALLAALHAGEDAVVPAVDGRLEPLHAVYACSALPVLERLLAGGRLGLRDALRDLSVRAVSEDEWGPHAGRGGRFALNLNRPEDLVSFTDA